MVYTFSYDHETELGCEDSCIKKPVHSANFIAQKFQFS